MFNHVHRFSFKLIKDDFNHHYYIIQYYKDVLLGASQQQY